MDTHDTRTIEIPRGQTRDVKAYTWNTAGTHDYKSEGFSIDRIVDRHGVEHTPRWEDDAIELFPGCRTSTDGRYHRVHISAEVCPIRVLYCHWFQYTGSDPEHSDSWRTCTWLRFEATSS